MTIRLALDQMTNNEFRNVRIQEKLVLCYGNFSNNVKVWKKKGSNKTENAFAKGCRSNNKSFSKFFRQKHYEIEVNGLTDKISSYSTEN